MGLITIDPDSYQQIWKQTFDQFIDLGFSETDARTMANAAIAAYAIADAMLEARK